MNVGLLLEMVGEAAAGRRLLGQGGGGDLDGPTLLNRARAGASWLRGRAGDKLVFLGLNGPDLPIALFAAAFAGRPFVPVNYRLADAELRRIVARTAPSLVVADADMAGRIAGVEGVEIVARADFAAACAGPQGEAPTDEEQEIAVLLFTSGTTGDPKAAVLRHANLSSYVISTVDFLGAGEDEAALVSVPPYHIAGISAILTAIYGGRRLVYLEAFSPEAWVDLAAAERVSHAMVVPTMLDRILDVIEARGERLPALRALSYGGGRMPAAVIERAMRLLPAVDFVNAYGLTETSSTIAVLGPEEHRAAMTSDDPAVRRRLGSVGRPLPTLELEVRAPDGSCCPPGISGEVYVRGDQVAGEYLHRKMLSDDGWFATNDAGFLDEEGYLFVEGRLDDVIVRGGENISPGEVEDVLRQHPGVADVAVLGLPDDRWGERVAAVIVPRAAAPAAEELAAFVRARLRSTKTPETWEVRQELPYSETGKLLRRILRAELAGLGVAA